MNQTALFVEASSFDDIQPPERVTEKYPHMPTPTIRWDIHERDRNGAAEAGCFVKVGKRYFVNVPRYLAWKLNKSA